uniref:Glycosyltransferase n=1 Tax=Oryza punctata TaxID=4537 RepID=A0A0E0JNP3_ORYPU
MAMAEKKVLLYPCPELGHLNPMVQLAEALVRRGVNVTLAVADPPHKGAVLAGAIAHIADACPSIGVRLLPIPSCEDKTYSHPVMWIVDAVRLANPALRELLRSLPAAIDALVVDMFCIDALDIAAELAVPAYMFYPSAASDLAVYLQVPHVARSAPSSFKDMADTVLSFSGVATVRALDMPDTMQDRESDVGTTRIHHCSRMAEARGILVNSFEWLETRALKAIRGGLCFPTGRSVPEIYCVGPLVDGGKIKENDERHECLEWLDSQPKQSVVFLCFGSRGTFSVSQLSEMARGIENSGHRFLWAVRNPPDHRTKLGEVDLEALLPEGFLERTNGRGFVVKNWAPQSAVLQHGAVGAFMTHCGWNSSLEAIMSGVPMICWPLYAEQRLNKVHLVEEIKVGVVVEGYDGELVKSDELETKVRLVMESEEGKKLRERSAMAKEMAADAVKDGGSSDMALAEFLHNLGTNNVKSGPRDTPVHD